MQPLVINPTEPRNQALMIDWPVPTYQNAWEFQQLIRLVQERKPRRLLEVGTFYGGTLKMWLEQMPPRSTVVSVDSPQPHASNPVLWHQWAVNNQQALYLISGDSHAPDTIAQAHQYAPYDLIFIDADHTYEAVSRDWVDYLPMIAPGGVVVFHDINERDGYGVSRLWSQIRLMGYVTQEINAGMVQCCGIGIVYC